MLFGSKALSHVVFGFKALSRVGLGKSTRVQEIKEKPFSFILVAAGRRGLPLHKSHVGFGFKAISHVVFSFKHSLA